MLNGVTATVKVANIPVCHGRMMFVRAYQRETQEMVFDADERAVRLFQGRPRARRLRQSMDVSRARRSVGVGAWNAQNLIRPVFTPLALMGVRCVLSS